MVTPTPIPKRLLAVMEHAEAFEPIQGAGSISRRRFCSATWGTPAEYSVGLKFAISRGWLGLHGSGTYVSFTQSGADPLRLRRWLTY